MQVNRINNAEERYNRSLQAKLGQKVLISPFANKNQSNKDQERVSREQVENGSSSLKSRGIFHLQPFLPSSFSIKKSLSNHWSRPMASSINPEYTSTNSNTETSLPQSNSSINDSNPPQQKKLSKFRKNSGVSISDRPSNRVIDQPENIKSEVKKLCCDKCDGKHETDDCPHYKRQRENHPDAQKGAWKKMGGTSTLPGAFIRNARVARQPGDGSCLFHSMCYGLKDGSVASTLREEICAYINRNPELEISETPLKDWVRWDSGTSVADYTYRMSRGAWGGGIEMATLSKMKRVNVHVYERYRGEFKRISAFDYPDSPETRKTVRVLYCGGVHYGTCTESR